MGLTFESLVLEVGRALGPLQERLRAGEVSLFFAELGLPAPDAVLGAQGVKDAIGAAADALAALPDVLAGLSAALASDDAVAIAAASGRAVPIVQCVMAAIDTVAAAVRTAAATAGPGRAEVEAFAAVLAERLLGYALAFHLERHLPLVSHLFILFGLVEITAHAATPAAPAHISRVVRFDRFPRLVNDPVDLVTEVYGWGSAGFAWPTLLRRLSTLFGRITDFAFVQAGPPPFLRIAFVDIGRTGDPTPGVQTVLRVAGGKGLDASLPIGDTVALTAKAEGGLEAGSAIALLPPADLRVVPPSAEARGALRVGVQAPHAAGAPPVVVLGVAGAARVEARRVRLGLGADLTWDPLQRRGNGAFVVEGALEGGKIVLHPAGVDGFVAALLPGGPLELDADLLVRWSSATGLHFDGEAGLHTTYTLHRSLGPFRLESVDVGFAAAADALTGTVGVTGSATLGPVTASVASLGTTVALRFQRGNLGTVDLGVAFKPPSGAGLAIDEVVVTGGGFLLLDPDSGQYAGIVRLNLEGHIAVTGIGLIATRLPDHAPGFSLLIVLAAQDFEPIPLGLGFNLTGIGGLLAINRTFDEGVLRAGLRDHTLDSLLFPRDPIRNAAQILSTVNRVFPPASGHHLFGPVARITWWTPTLITADLALVLELGARLRLLILAQIRAILPAPDNDLIRLQMDAVGVIDFDQSTAALDATLHDSRLLRKFTLTGDMAMRLSWGSSPSFTLAIGGLHPAFNPPPGFPKLERIALNLAAGDNPRLRCEAYLALTANTVQFGARAELYASAAGFAIQGETGFDVLIQLTPFAFLAAFYAQLQLKRGSTNLFKVRVEGTLAGPRPLHLTAKATFEILWWDVTIRVDTTLVEGETPPFPAPVDVLPLLGDALGSASNWVSQLPAGQRQLVTLRDATPGAGAPAQTPLHPLGTLVVKQNVVPLDLDISRFGSATPAGARRFSITGASVGGQAQTTQPVRDFFAPAQFIEMSDDEKLARPSFESLNGGVVIGSGDFAIPAGAADWLEVPAIEFETLIVDKATGQTRPSPPPEQPGRYRLLPVRLGQQARFGAAGSAELRRAGRARYRATTDRYRVAREGWTVATTDDLTVQATSVSYSEAVQAATTLARQQPARAAALTILRRSELSIA